MEILSFYNQIDKLQSNYSLYDDSGALMCLGSDYSQEVGTPGPEIIITGAVISHSRGISAADFSGAPGKITTQLL